MGNPIHNVPASYVENQACHVQLVRSLPNDLLSVLFAARAVVVVADVVVVTDVVDVVHS